MEENESKSRHIEEKRTHNELPGELEEPETEGNTESSYSTKEELLIKNMKIERLKEDIEVLRQQLEVVQETSLEINKISSEFLLLKCTNSDILFEKKFLEEENESIRKTLEEAEVKINYLTAELTKAERLRQEVQVLLCTKDAEINEWKNRCEKDELEISDLIKEYIRVSSERLSHCGSLPSEIRPAESLDYEYNKFQSSQERIEEMTINCSVIGEEQSKLLNRNEKLEKNCANLEAVVRKVNLEKTEFERQSVELNEKLTIMLERNKSLIEENKVLNLKVRDFEKFDMHDHCRKELLVEKQNLESNLLALSRELHSSNRQLEEAIIENKNYETALQNTKTALQDKITALLVMTSDCGEVQRDRYNLINRLENAENELKTIENEKNALQRELFPCHSLIEQSAEENALKYALLEQKLARCANELDRVQSLYQKCFIENNRLKMMNNEHQSQLLGDFENRYYKLANEKPEIETSLQHKISLLGHQEQSISVSNKNTIEERVQESIHKHGPEIEDIARISDGAVNLPTLLNNDLAEELKKSIQMNGDLQEKLGKSREEIENFSRQLLENIRLYDSSQDAEKSRIEATAENQNICDLLNILFDKLRLVILETKNFKELDKSLEKKLQQVEANNSYLQNEMQKMTSKLYNEIDEKCRIKNAMRTKSEENKNLRTQVQNLHAKLKLTSDKLNETIEEKVKIEASANDLRLKCQNVQKFEQPRVEDGIRNLIKESEYVRVQIENLMQEFTVAVIELECLKVEKENLGGLLHKWEVSNITLSAEVDEWRNKYNEIAEEQNQTNNEVQKLVEESKYLFNEAVNVFGKLKCIQSRSKYFELAKARIERKFSQLSAVTNKNHRTLMRSCTQEYDVKVEDISELNNYTSQEFIREYETLETQNATLQEKLDSKTKEVDDLKLLLENMEDNLRGANVSFELLSCQVLRQLERLKEANKNLKNENSRLLESNREKLEFLKLVENRIIPVAREIDDLKLSNKELERVNNNMKEELQNRIKNELRLEAINSKLKQAVRRPLDNGTEVSNENDDVELLSSMQKISSEQKLELEEQNNDRKLVTLESNDIEVLKNNETRLINEMEKLHDQNKILRLEVDQLIVHVGQFSNNGENSTSKFESTQNTLYKFPNGENDKLENVELRKCSALSEDLIIDPMKKENHDFPGSLKELELEDAEIREKKETVVNEHGIQSQLRTMSLKNEMLLTENEQLRESLKSLEFDYTKMRKKLDETEERFRSSDGVLVKQTEKMKMLEYQIQDGRKRENQLSSQLKTLNVKLVEESEQIAILKRTHTTQLQKQIKINKSLESRIHNYENKESGESWKPLNSTEQKTKLEEFSEGVACCAEGTDMKILVNEYENGKPEDERNADSNDAYERFQAKKGDLRKRRVTLEKLIDGIGHILSSGESDIDNLQNHFKTLKDEYQRVIQFEDEWENQFKDELLYYENKRTNRKYDQLPVINSETTKKSLEKEKLIESLIEHLPRQNGHGIINTGSTEKLRSSILGTHEAASGVENNEIDTIYLHRENLESMEMSAKQSRCPVNSLSKIRSLVALPKILFKEKLQDATTMKYNEMAMKVGHCMNKDKNTRNGNEIFSRIFILCRRINLLTFIRQNYVYSWLLLSTCFVYFLTIYLLVD